jgi:TM2 domain-containing membrane protein YozV
MFCSGCGRGMSATDQFCPGCGKQANVGASTSLAGAPGAAVAPARQPMPPPPQQVMVVRSLKNPGVAAVLSFFWAGLGQIYNGEIGKGILVMVLYFISALLMFVVIGFLTTPILWIVGMVDAYKTAEKINAIPGNVY